MNCTTHHMLYTVCDTNKLHLFEEFFGLLTQADTDTSTVTLWFSARIFAEESRQVVHVASYENRENQVAANLKSAVNLSQPSWQYLQYELALKAVTVLPQLT